MLIGIISMSHWQLALDAIARALRAFISNCKLRKCACDLFGTTKREGEKKFKHRIKANFSRATQTLLCSLSAVQNNAIAMQHKSFWQKRAICNTFLHKIPVFFVTLHMNTSTGRCPT
jgi:hypothetical protein